MTETPWCYIFPVHHLEARDGTHDSDDVAGVCGRRGRGAPSTRTASNDYGEGGSIHAGAGRTAARN